MDRRHGGDAQIQAVVVGADAGASILRQPALGDVEAG